MLEFCDICIVDFFPPCSIVKKLCTPISPYILVFNLLILIKILRNPLTLIIVSIVTLKNYTVVSFTRRFS